MKLRERQREREQGAAKKPQETSFFLKQKNKMKRYPKIPQRMRSRLKMYLHLLRYRENDWDERNFYEHVTGCCRLQLIANSSFQSFHQ